MLWIDTSKPMSGDPARRFAASATRLGRVSFQVFGEPSQVAVAYQRVAGEMAKKRFVSWVWFVKRLIRCEHRPSL